MSLSSGTVTVVQDAGGDRTASAAGVLRFTFSDAGTRPAAPTGITSAAVTNSRVDISWNTVLAATSYEVDRQDAGGGFEQIGSSAGSSFSDMTASPDRAYLYRVRAANGSGTSGDSTFDLATSVIFTNDPLSSVTNVTGAHLTQLRTAIDAVRSLAGLPAASVTDASPAGKTIKSAHITELRTALDAALTGLGLPAGGYANSPLTGAMVKAIDFQELRTRVR